jgi:hypothetical protein
MYESKAAGRDRVTFHPASTRNGLPATHDERLKQPVIN